MEIQLIQQKIYEKRATRVMLDFDLALMYGTETRRLKEQVKRNMDRFPSDFMFQLTKLEWKELVANCDKLPESIKHNPSTPFAFTEQGVAMLSGVLRSSVAVQVNISIMRAFISVRQYIIDSTNTIREIEDLKKSISILFEDVESLNRDQDANQEQFDDIYLALSQLAEKHKKSNLPRNSIGYKIGNTNCE